MNKIHIFFIIILIYIIFYFSTTKNIEKFMDDNIIPTKSPTHTPTPTPTPTHAPRPTTTPTFFYVTPEMKCPMGKYKTKDVCASCPAPYTSLDGRTCRCPIGQVDGIFLGSCIQCDSENSVLSGESKQYGAMILNKTKCVPI
jgi:hypothetical protein